MLYDSYRENVVYNSQSKINFPKSGNSEKIGYGVSLFLLCPNRVKALSVINDPKINLIQSNIKRFITDTVYKEKIGTKKIISLERSQTDKFYMRLPENEFPLHYIPTSARASILNKKSNIVNDLSRWMELFFSRIESLSAKRICDEFTRILANKINSSEFNGYEKLIVIDINTWSNSIKNCVIMNKKLLNNPLSILLFSAYYFPQFIERLPNIRFMIINRSASQLYIISTNFLTKKNYPKIKAKLSTFKSLIFSVEDECEEYTDSETVNDEVKAEVISSFKDEIKKKLKYNLLGNGDNSFNNYLEDITSETSEEFDEFEKELSDFDEKTNDDENSSSEEMRYQKLTL